MRNQKGFLSVVIIGVIVVAAVAGFIGYKVINSNKSTNETSTSQAENQNQTTTQAVDATVKEVDAVTVDDSTLDEIDAQLNY